MNVSLFEEKKYCLGRSKTLNLLANAIRKPVVVKLSVMAALMLFGASNCEFSFAQQRANVQGAPVSVATPWTTQDGRLVVSMNTTSSKTPKRVVNRIRQTSMTVQDDPLAGTLEDYSDVGLEDPTQYASPEMTEELQDPSDVDLIDGGVEDISSEVVEPLPTVAPSRQTVAPTNPTIQPQAPKTAPVLSTEAQNYPQSATLSNPEPANRQGTFSNAASNAPHYSSNPYSRIGQAEYNPNQFYGGGNYSVNGYRNMPPAEAYGQSICADGQCGYGCGFFGSIIQNTQLEAGAVSMRSPLDFEDSGNTGSQFAVNFGSSQPVFCGFNVQAGARGVFTDYNGAKANGFETDNSRNQLFWTAGLYFRSPAYSGGWSGGIVYDSLTENYCRDYNLSQLRAELSYNFTGFCEIGFRGAFALNEDWFDLLKLDADLRVEAKATGTSYYTMFLRKRCLEGAEFNVYGGVTEWSEGLVGATAEAPLSDSFALRGAASYVFPTERGLNDKAKEETWNISVGLAWYLGGNARNTYDSQRPLFDVADNGSFLQNFLR